MKTVFSMFISLFLLAGAAAQTDTKIKWYSIEEAVRLNKTAPKKILIDIYTDWCGWCKKMDAETFSYAEIAQYINTHYYPVKFDAESTADIHFAGEVFKGGQASNGRKQTHQFAIALFNGKNIGYPAIAYLTEDLEIISTVPGYRTPQQIEPLLHYIVENKYRSMYLAEYEKTFVSKLKKK
ncbi:MAG: DUF255 domain-containing protein [Bacteroidales bacterium]|jgi:thioredoxin-related protein|nr:DUF255 domain-containing protein [Bacteroidales bacterium]